MTRSPWIRLQCDPRSAGMVRRDTRRQTDRSLPTSWGHAGPAWPGGIAMPSAQENARAHAEQDSGQVAAYHGLNSQSRLGRELSPCELLPRTRSMRPADGHGNRCRCTPRGRRNRDTARHQPGTLLVDASMRVVPSVSDAGLDLQVGRTNTACAKMRAA
jgi:hypothetical protein